MVMWLKPNKNFIKVISWLKPTAIDEKKSVSYERAHSSSLVEAPAWKGFQSIFCSILIENLVFLFCVDY